MQIIDDELRRRGIELPGGEDVVLRRVIHTTADFDYVENLVFVGDAVASGIAALRDAATIVTDTTMAQAGISKPALARVGAKTRCYVGDADVAQDARDAHVTRAVMAMRKALRENERPVVAVGNAPTALFELCERMSEGARPALVVAVPVGFVNVVEAKEEVLRRCEELKAPAIVARGRKGGSTVATAIVNALLYEATNLGDPRSRAKPL